MLPLNILKIWSRRINNLLLNWGKHRCGQILKLYLKPWSTTIKQSKEPSNRKTHSVLVKAVKSFWFKVQTTIMKAKIRTNYTTLLLRPRIPKEVNSSTLIKSLVIRKLTQQPQKRIHQFSIRRSSAKIFWTTSRKLSFKLTQSNRVQWTTEHKLMKLKSTTNRCRKRSRCTSKWSRR